MRVQRKSAGSTVCNLCSRKFRRKSVFIRYCDNCRQKSVLYRFADSLAMYTGPCDDADEADLSAFTGFEITA